ncbi:MAG: transposase [Pseudomonadota bacterium]
MGLSVLGINLGNTTCSVAGLDGDGAIAQRKRIQRHRLLDFLAQMTPCIVAMEACGGAHHVGHFCVEHGHEPRLMPRLDLQALHRARERLVQSRTRLVNQARGLLMERGIRSGTGRRVFQRELGRLLDEDGRCVMPGMVRMLSEMASELREVNDRIADLDRQIRTHARRDADMQRSMEIPGVGPSTATALVATIGDRSSFTKARDLSAWLGLLPR